jgi:hypothetical protein
LIPGPPVESQCQEFPGRNNWCPCVLRPFPSDWRSIRAPGEPMPTRNIADRQARLQRLVHHRELLLRRKPPPASNARDDFHLRNRLGHRRMPRTMPGSSGYRRCPVKTGCSSSGSRCANNISFKRSPGLIPEKTIQCLVQAQARRFESCVRQFSNFHRLAHVEQVDQNLRIPWRQSLRGSRYHQITSFTYGHKIPNHVIRRDENAIEHNERQR